MPYYVEDWLTLSDLKESYESLLETVHYNDPEYKKVNKIVQALEAALQWGDKIETIEKFKENMGGCCVAICCDRS